MLSCQKKLASSKFSFTLLLSIIVAIICASHNLTEKTILIAGKNFSPFILTTTLLVNMLFYTYKKFNYELTLKIIQLSIFSLSFYVFCVTILVSIKSPVSFTKDHLYTTIFNHYLLNYAVNLIILLLCVYIPFCQLLKKNIKPAMFVITLLVIQFVYCFGSIGLNHLVSPTQSKLNITASVAAWLIFCPIITIISSSIKMYNNPKEGNSYTLFYKRREQPFMGWTCFDYLASIAITLLIISHTLAYKLIVVFGYTLPASGVLFPITFLIGETIAEVYGFRANMAIIYGILLCQIVFNLIMFTFSMCPSSQTALTEAYHGVYGNFIRQLFASTPSVFAAFTINAFFVSKLKINLYRQKFIVRIFLSNILAKTVLCFINYFALFLGVYSVATILKIIYSAWIFKFSFAILGTPFVIVFIKWLKEKDKLDNYDHGETFHPLRLTPN